MFVCGRATALAGGRPRPAPMRAASSGTGSWPSGLALSEGEAARSAPLALAGLPPEDCPPRIRRRRSGLTGAAGAGGVRAGRRARAPARPPARPRRRARVMRAQLAAGVVDPTRAPRAGLQAARGQPRGRRARAPRRGRRAARPGARPPRAGAAATRQSACSSGSGTATRSPRHDRRPTHVRRRRSAPPSRQRTRSPRRSSTAKSGSCRRRAQSDGCVRGADEPAAGCEAGSKRRRVAAAASTSSCWQCSAVPRSPTRSDPARRWSWLRGRGQR